MKLQAVVLSVICFSLFSGIAIAESETKLGVTSDGVEVTKAPKTFSAVHLIQSVVPGTTVVRQELGFKERADMSMTCYYLVRGSADDSRSLQALLKPENVIQFNCEKQAK